MIIEARPHCDDAIDAPETPEPLRAWLAWARGPGHGALAPEPPPVFATLDGRRVRLMMASRFGDVGVNFNLDARSGYSRRVLLDQLTEVSTERRAER